MSAESYHLRHSIGYLPQNLALPKWASGKDLLVYAASLKGLDKPGHRVEEVLTKWHCEQFANHPIASYSHGMEKRIGLSLASLSEPKILILDEPFSGLDYKNISTLKTWIKSRGNSDCITILSTHIVPFAAELSQEVLFINQGRITTLAEWNSVPNINDRMAIFEAEIKNLMDP